MTNNEDHIISEGVIWTVVDVLSDRKFEFTSWNSWNPEADAREFFEAYPREPVILTSRKAVIYQDERKDERGFQDENYGYAEESHD